VLITAGHFWLHAPHRFNPGGNGLAYLHGYTTNGLGDSRYNNSAAFGKLAARPNGASNQTSWILPRKAGGMSSYSEAVVSLNAVAAILGGKALEGSATLTISTNEPAGELIAFGIGSVTITLSTNNPLLTASINGGGEASFEITTNVPVLGAEASIVGTTTITISVADADILPVNDDPVLREATATMSFSGTLIPYARGHMIGTTEESGLTPAGIANTVWSKIIEAGFSAEQIMRLLAAQAAGSATGLESSNPQFTGLDGSTVRIDGTYSAGTRTIDSLNGD
jgi:hypothetical protein